MIQRFRRRLDSESGVTLVELVVVIGLMSIVLGFVLQGFVSMQNAFVQGETRLENLDEARQLMDTVTKDLRTATSLTAGTDPFLIADSREIKYYANLNNSSGGPVLVHIYVRSDNALLEETTPPDASSVPPNYTYTGSPVARLVGQYVSNTTTPIFTYYDANGSTLPTPLSSANQLLVQSIGITLQIKKVMAENIPGTTLTNQVTLPNVYLTVIPTPSASP
jgi:type II secretory pathway pseudopilin PulG